MFPVFLCQTSFTLPSPCFTILHPCSDHFEGLPSLLSPFFTPSGQAVGQPGSSRCGNMGNIDLTALYERFNQIAEVLCFDLHTLQQYLMG